MASVKKGDKFLGGNESLPININVDYTIEQASEMQKCMDDIIYFAENYFYIVNLDKGRQKIKLFDAQKEAIEGIMENKLTIICASRQIGKLLDLNTEVPTPNGWTTMGQLKDGDTIFDWYGNPTKVLNAHDVVTDGECYELTFSNGEKITADANHEWFTQSRTERRHNSEGSVKTTKQILDTLLVGQKDPEPQHRIPIKHCVKYPEKDLLIDPYLFGAWLGDGSSAGNIITCGEEDVDDMFNNALSHIPNKVQLLNVRNMVPAHYKKTYSIKIQREEDNIPFITKLRALNVYKNKHIPVDYVQSSVEQRLALVQGLMDTDGHIEKRGICQFYTIIPKMAEQFKEILYSLGIQCNITSKIPKIKDKEYSRVYSVTFKTQLPVFRLKRKLEKLHEIKRDKVENNRNKFIYIKSIVHVDTIPMRCITIEHPEQMYLVGRTFVSSHNTTLLSVVCLWCVLFKKDYQIAVLANKEDQAKEILERIKLAYEELPNWLKTGVSEFTKEVLKLVNGSKIFVSTTSESGIRGKSVNLLFVDEFAHILHNIAEPFFKSVMPTVSSSESAKIVLVSCVTGDTCVITDKGMFEIRELIDQSKEGLYQIPEYSVLGKHKTRRGTEFYNSGVSPIHEISCHATSLKCSPNHKLFSCKDGVYGWNEVQNLVVGDYIAVQHGNDIWGNSDNIEDFEPSVNKKIVDIFHPKVITPDIAYLVGIFLAEGSTYKKYVNGNFTGGAVTLTCGDSLHEAITCVGLPYSLSKDGLHYAISSKNFIEFLEYLGFDLSKRAPKKIIPDKLLKWSRPNIVALLQGIFDGDGSIVRNGTINILLSSKVFIKQLRNILLNFGILTQYCEGVTPPTERVKVFSNYYRITFASNDAQKFYQNIGFRFERKQKIARQFYENTKLRANSLDVIPHVCEMFKPDFKKVKKRFLKKGITNGFYLDAKLSRQQLLDFKETYGFSNDLLNQIVDKNIRWEKIKSNEVIGEEPVYDFVLPNLEETDIYDWNHSVIYNGVLGHQTPKGSLGKFYEIFRDAELGKNNWKPVRIHYSQVPGRDEAWKQQQLASINNDMDLWRQEFELEFLENGAVALNKHIIDDLKAMCRDADFAFEEGEYLLWKEPQPGRIISIGVDVAEGKGGDYTVAIILDITDPMDIELCGIYASNKVNPWVFAEQLNKIARSWGRPFLCIENNADGGTVIQALIEVHGYDNIVTYNMENDKRGYYQKPGIFCHQNAKNLGIQNMKYFLEIRRGVSIYSAVLVSEFESFIRKTNRIWGAKPGHHDDHVMALTWGLILLEKRLAEQYLEVHDYDDTGKPSVITDPNQHLADAAFTNISQRHKPIRDVGGHTQEFNIFFNPTMDKGLKIAEKYQGMIEECSWEFV